MRKTRRDKHFKEDYKRLSPNIQKRVKKIISLLIRDIRHPSLRVHKIEGYESIYEAYVTMKYRITFEIHPDYYYLRRVGEHGKVLKNP